MNKPRVNRLTAMGGTLVLAAFFCFPAATRAYGQSTDVLTYHNDVARTGQNLNEQILSPANVTSAHFGKLWTLNVDGLVDAEPLYAAGINIPGQGMRNVVFVVTEHDSVYAFDADSTNLFWEVSMLITNETTSDDRGCGQVSPEIGITSTPVIDRQLGPNGTMFLVAMSKEPGTTNYFHRVHALDLATGADRVPAATVTAKFPGLGDSTDGTNVVFEPAQYKERSGLLLLNGVIYTAWASHCDFAPYTGWIIGYDEHTLAQTNVFNIDPNGSEGAIWMAGDGLAADSSSNLLFLAANGTFETTLTNGFPILGDYGNAFIKISTTNKQLAVADYFAMATVVNENSSDTDLGSGGELVLPDMVDAQSHTRYLAVGAGKDGNIYLVDRTNMGKFSPTNDNAIYQEMDGALPGGIWSMPAYFNGVLYYGSVSYYLQAFPFQNARLTNASSHTATSFGYPGTTPSISAVGNSNGIVWATENTSPAVLHAYAATNLATELYNSTQAGSRDNFGSGNKFITPMIASARVYVGTASDIGVLGLLDTATLTLLEVWRNTYFRNPSNVGAGANVASPAGDGVPNLIKYALGLNPTNPATAAQLPSGGIQSSGGQSYLTMTINRTAEPSDVTYTVQVSSNLLSGWVSGSPYTVTLTNTASQLVVRDNIPVPAATARFIRLADTSP
jgi:hypothetical protein